MKNYQLMSFSDYLGVFLSLLFGTLLILFMLYYDPLILPARSGQCLKYREAKQTGLFMSDVECIEWQK